MGKSASDVLPMLSSRNKRRIVLALYHRGRLSLGDQRSRLRHSAYHWAILVAPKHTTTTTTTTTTATTVGCTNNTPLPPFSSSSSSSSPSSQRCNLYDAADIAVLDPNTGEDLNPNRDWVFRAREGVDPAANGRLVARIVVGKLPSGTADGVVDALLRAVSLPRKHAEPCETCVTWALGALQALQHAGLVWPFDVSVFKDWALAYADECMKRLDKENLCEYHPGR